MNGRIELNNMDLEILDAINREWQADRLKAAHNERLLRGGESRRASKTGWARLAVIALGAGLIAALLIGLAVAAAAGGTASSLAGLMA